MATRIYTQSSGSVGVTPSTWNFANQINPVTVPGTLTKNTGSTMTSKTEATGTTSPTNRAMGRTIIGPLAAQTISGTIKGQMRGSENNAGANATLGLAVKIVQPGGTDRAVLLAQTASDSATAGNELVVNTLTNAQFKDAAESASITLTSQAATAGDYLVIEWGFRSATTTSRNVTLSYGNDSATDLAEDTSTTAANNPWWEFSADLKFLAETEFAVSASSATSPVSAVISQSEFSISADAASSFEGEAATGTTIEESEWTASASSASSFVTSLTAGAELTASASSAASVESQSVFAASASVGGSSDSSFTASITAGAVFDVSASASSAVEGENAATPADIIEAEWSVSASSAASVESSYYVGASFSVAAATESAFEGEEIEAGPQTIESEWTATASSVVSFDAENIGVTPAGSPSKGKASRGMRILPRRPSWQEEPETRIAAASFACGGGTTTKCLSSSRYVATTGFTSSSASLARMEAVNVLEVIASKLKELRIAKPKLTAAHPIKFAPKNPQSRQEIDDEDCMIMLAGVI